MKTMNDTEHICECGLTQILRNREAPELKEWVCPCGIVEAANEYGNLDLSAFSEFFSEPDDNLDEAA